MTFTQKKGLLRSGIPILLGFLWAAVQAGTLLHVGPRTAVDSTLYLRDAAELLRGHWPTGYSVWYIGYSGYLAAVKLIGGEIVLAVLGQILFSGAAAVAMWRIVRHISHSVTTAHGGVLLYIGWLKIHHWNVFIYTESLFTSYCLLSFAVLIMATRIWHIGAVVLLLAYTFLLRPNGFCFLVGVAALLGSWLYWSREPRWWQWPVVAVAGVGLLLLLNRMLANYILVESYARAEIIYPGISLGIVPPSSLYIPATTIPPLLRLLLFVFFNPLYFSKLFIVKLALFLGNIKPYFSVLHNLLVALILWPLYFLAVRGWHLFPARSPIRYGILGFIAAQTLTVALTTENWDGRFLVPILPFVFMLSAIGFRGRRLSALVSPLYMLQKPAHRQHASSRAAQQRPHGG